MKTISVISPAYNEVENVRLCYERLKAIFAEHLPDYRLEHIFADNASSDGTVDILREIAAADASVKVILNSRNFGPFRSLFNGLRYATGDAVVVFMPVDMQDPPELIPEFVRYWEQGIEVVAGARAVREETWLLRKCRSVFYHLVNSLSDFEITPNVGEFQLIDRKVWDAIMQYDDHYPYVRGIIASVGFKRLIVPYTWGERKRGISKNNFPRLIDQALNGIFSFTNAPMRLCIYLGFTIAAICIAYALFSISMFLFFPTPAPRGTATIIASIFFLSGIQLAFIGMLGEYVTSIHSQVRKRPLVVERERLNIDEKYSPKSSNRSLELIE
ncbi:glycosyltransferase [Rhizobiales bacterium RZME27]|uniref:Glycosyltransferase n=1 Tax=Endobacterium cereale TaxID=2663029 RepID=A0A6A8A7H8_9HYPH|nr:glycosyltransferase family 2 protein [Endobacterium cereale]MQY46654.1 glycosyltransferase [Endobacterium cereale]